MKLLAFVVNFPVSDVEGTEMFKFQNLQVLCATSMKSVQLLCPYA